MITTDLREQQWNEAEDAYYDALHEYADFFGGFHDDTSDQIWEDHAREQAYLRHFRDGEPAIDNNDTRLLRGLLGRVAIRDNVQETVISFTPKNAFKGEQAKIRKDSFDQGVPLDKRHEVDSYDQLVRYQLGKAPTIEEGLAEVSYLEDEESLYIGQEETRTHWTRAIRREGKKDLTFEQQEEVRKLKEQREQEIYARNWDELSYKGPFSDYWLDLVEEDDEEPATEELDGFFREQFELSKVKPSGR